MLNQLSHFDYLMCDLSFGDDKDTTVNVILKSAKNLPHNFKNIKKERVCEDEYQILQDFGCANTIVFF